MNKQESKILTELIELKDIVTKVKDIFKTDLSITTQKILDKVDIDKYEFIEEEKQVEQEIENIMEFISYIVDEFYNYDEKDLDKLITK